MKKAKDYSQAKQLYFNPEIKLCPHCSHPLKKSYIAWQKHVFTLKGTYHVTSYAHKCTNPKCTKPQAAYRSVKAETLSLKYYQYGLDVTAKIGHLYFQKHQTIDQITQTLKKTGISRSEVNLQYQAYLALTTAQRRQNPTWLDKIIANGYIILAIDGAQPEKGNETVWILRDALTRTTLLAKNLQSQDKDSIAQLLREIKALGIPVKGVISDGQRSIRLSVKAELPDVPHQLCHFHFLRNIAKCISDMDRALKVDLKKKARGIKPIEQTCLGRTDQKSQLIVQFCLAIRFALQDDGCYPLEPGGLRLFRRLRKIQQTIQKINNPHPDKFLTRLLKVLAVVDEFKWQYRRVNRLYKLIFKAAKILGQEGDASKVEADMLGYFDFVAKVLVNSRLKAERTAVANILGYTANYWEGLFCHFDQTQIPRTNNDLELFIRKLKTARRKTSGRASCQGFMVRYGAYVSLLDYTLSQELMLYRLGRVDYGVFRQCYGEVRSFRCRLRFKRSLSEDFTKFLSGLERGWVKVAV